MALAEELCCCVLPLLRGLDAAGNGLRTFRMRALLEYRSLRSIRSAGAGAGAVCNRRRVLILRARIFGRPVPVNFAARAYVERFSFAFTVFVSYSDLTRGWDFHSMRD